MQEVDPDIGAGSSTGDQRVIAEPVRTEADKAVWRAHLMRMREIHQTHPSWFLTEYLDALASMDFGLDEIPTIGALNAMLSHVSWRAIYVDGMVPDQQYHEMFANRIFPIAIRIRRMRDIEHSAAPDFLHDVLGHLPMLMLPSYQALIQEWARRSLQSSRNENDEVVARALAELIDEHEKDHPNSDNIDNARRRLSTAQQRQSLKPSDNAIFAKFYAWMVEYGLIATEEKGPIIVGAAILSSPAQAREVIDGLIEIRPYSHELLKAPVDYTRVQDVLYSALDIEQMRRDLAHVELSQSAVMSF